LKGKGREGKGSRKGKKEKGGKRGRVIATSRSEFIAGSVKSEGRSLLF